MSHSYEDRSRAAWKRISAKRGRRAYIARALHLQWGTITGWTRVPLEHVFAVARIVKIRPERLRPDFFRNDPLRRESFPLMPQKNRSKIATHSNSVPMNNVTDASAAASDMA